MEPHRVVRGLDFLMTTKTFKGTGTEPREVKPPADLVKALKAVPGAWDRWRALSYSHQREHVAAIEEAKRPDTRSRRIANCTRMVSARRT